MRIRLNLPFIGITIPANTPTATFVPADQFRSTKGYEEAHSQSEMRLKTGTAEAQPALQFVNEESDNGVTQGIGTNTTANGISFPIAATSVKTNMGQYKLYRQGWLVKNTHATDPATAVIGGWIDI